MIINYLRPKSIKEAYQLLQNSGGKGFIVGGGTYISTHQTSNGIAIDLQEVGNLNTLEKSNDKFQIGSRVTLQELADCDDLDPVLKEVLKNEVGRNIRQAATIAGHLVKSDGRSPLTTCLLGLDANLGIYPINSAVSMGDWLPLRNSDDFQGIITEITFGALPNLRFDYVARTPKDRPVVCAAVVIWPGGRTRVALGGFGPSPIMIFDGPDSSGAGLAALDAYSNAEDCWASADYRMDAAQKLVNRLLVSGKEIPG